jgi:hypothetical protein
VADEIMVDIDADIDAGMTSSCGERIPLDVDDFGLHDYCDANTYLIDHLGEQITTWHTDAEAEQANALCNAITDEISRPLAERAPKIRQQMADLVTFDLGWYTPADLDTVEREHDEVRMVADAFADTDADGVYLDGTYLDRDWLAECMRNWCADAEAWLLAGRPDRTAQEV